MKKYTPLSVVIITFNEERNIQKCIEAVQLIADEIVIVDSYSTDNTLSIASAMGATIYQNKFEGHIEQKNFAITKAKYPHILSLDADEYPDQEFLEAIQKIKQNWDADGYSVNRLNNYCGKWIKHGAWYPDVKLRLWDSRKGMWQGTNPHDKFVLVEGSKQHHVKGNILHFSYQQIAEHVKKADYFSTIAAKAYYHQGKKSTMFKIAFSPLFRFIRDYIIKLGFLDGYSGLVIAKTTALEVYLKYQKLFALQQGKTI
ncbi:MAG: glycosyltransferase family 2 protein [Bacteroidia bacterium]|jgi:glycosyltransferase involved in cell wall biosynthesis|nr:glycosyltransferase family 2 protein [Bacteroidia bacterium]